MGSGPEYIDAAKFADWIFPNEARKRSAPNVGGSYRAEDFIAELLGDGMVRAAAAHAIVSIPDQDEKRVQHVVIPAHHLAAMSRIHENAIWDTSTLEVWTEQGNARVKYYGIRIDPAELAEMLPPPPSPVPADTGPNAANTAPHERHPGGAPPKAFWDDLWLAMFERLWLTDWNPKNQTEIENAMLDWASEKGHKLGSTTVKAPAKKLFLLSKK